MRILVVGSGAREHALAWRLAMEADVVCAPGNPGIAEDVETTPVATADFAGLTALALDRRVDLVVVGPEDPLIAGLGDHLRTAGLTVFGPGALGAQLEGSKVFSKELMVEARIPTASHHSFAEPGPAKEFARSLFDKCGGAVVKASGAALGKGAIVCDSLAEAQRTIDDLLVHRLLGDAGSEIVVEQRLKGPEFSLLTLVSGRHHWSLPVAQDFKRAFDGDQGGNTGGMGSFSPVGWVPREMVELAERSVVEPLLCSLQNRGIDFRGVVFSGLLVDDGTPYCLEFNVRFGDPEIQSLVRRLGSGFASALTACALGDPIPPVEVLPNAAVTVVVASGGYPDAPRKGFEIILPKKPTAKIFHAGTSVKDGKLVNSGGRVFSVTGIGASVEAARDEAYRTAREIKFEGAFMRGDIALTG